MRRLSLASSPSSMTGRAPASSRAPARASCSSGNCGHHTGPVRQDRSADPGEAEPRAMSHPVIPAPAQFDSTEGRFALQPGTAIGYTAPAVAPLVERFCAEVARRTGLRLAPLAGNAGPGEPAVRIELVAGGELGVLPVPLGISPAGGGPPDERHSLAIDAGEVMLRAVEPAGVARGLTTLIQLLAAAPDSRAGAAWLPGARILDAPRYAWRGLSL